MCLLSNPPFVNSLDFDDSNSLDCSNVSLKNTELLGTNSLFEITV